MPDKPRSLRMTWTPTGAVRLRSTWFGLAVCELQEEREVPAIYANALQTIERWEREMRWVRLSIGQGVLVRTDEAMGD